MYDNQARTRDPLFDRFTSIDPMAEKYPDFSPYVVCKNNPLMRIDPDGRDDFYVDDYGNYRSTPNTERISFTMEEDKSKNIQIEKRVNTQEAENKINKEHKTNYIYFTDESAATKIYEFLIENTKVEWTMLKMETGENEITTILSTSHEKVAEYGQDWLLSTYDQKYQIKDVEHNHRNNSEPSDNDVRVKETHRVAVQETKFKPASFYINFQGRHIKY